MLFVALAAAAVVAKAATPPNTPVTNIASANYLIGGTQALVIGAVTVNTALRTPASIEFLQYIPQGSGGTVENVALTQCNGQPMPAPNYIMPPATALVVPGPLRLAPATEYVKGDPVFIKVTDYDQNLNPLLAETIHLSIGGGADTEQLVLTETGLSTGVFIGYIQSKSTVGSSNDCQLNIAGTNIPIKANYTDSLDATPTIADNALVDPFGVLFNSSSGVGVNGGIISMIDMATGLPAAVYCDDGVTVLPQPVTTGSPTICDPTVDSGFYRFPRALPGNYRFKVISPVGHAFPSAVAIANLPPGFSIYGELSNNGASYGGSFPLNLGPALHIDLPVDPSSGNIQIVKTSNKTIVGEGEFVSYGLTIKNVGAVNANGVMIADRLPLGFRYRLHSAQLNGVIVSNPSIAADGRLLTFSVGSIAKAASVVLKYVVEVTPAAKIGTAENTAYATGEHRSNVARASVLVREDLMRSKIILMGTVFSGSCEESSAKGMPNIRILLENGAYVLSDSSGHWHFDNVTSGTHVVQLDTDSIPKGYELLDCHLNNRVAGRNYSQFVNVRGGGIWRANFFLRPINPLATNEVKTLGSRTAKADQVIKKEPRSLVEKLNYDADWLASADVGAEWLHPQKGFSPALPVIKFAVKHHPSDTVKIKLNGENIGGYNYDGVQINEKKTIAVSSWSGANIKENENVLDVEVTGKNGLVFLKETRRIYYSEGPAKVELVQAKSKLIADGKTQPMIAVRLLDRNQRPARRGISGEYQLNAPYESVTQQEALRRDSASGNINGNKPSYEVDDDGIAYIQLAPTTHSGEAILTFDFGLNKMSNTINLNTANNDAQVRAWLVPGQRDWVLVGFAQGTVGHKVLSGNVQSAKDAKVDDDLFDQNRVAFYAKGTVSQNTLLTIAYDSAKPQTHKGVNAILKQGVEPDKFYTVYADATQAYPDAASARKLYLKVERAQFYAMFGDFDTGLSLTEFSRYSRSLNGIKSEYKDESLSYNAFAAMTAYSFKKDEILGNGTSGVYALSSRQIVQNSDKVRIETRDRLRTEIVLKTVSLTRFLDYNIDYSSGQLFFNSPISTNDFNLNPNFIVAEYEAGDGKDERLTAGGRAAFQLGGATSLGLTAVHEGNIGAKGDLYGVDMNAQLAANTKAVLEYAQSNHQSTTGLAKGSAWKAEVVHSDGTIDAKAYIREQGSGFGLNQQAASESGTRKAGLELRYKIADDGSLQGQTYEQVNLGNATKQRVVETRVDQKLGEDTNVFYGARAVRETDINGVQKSDKQLLGGASHSILEKQVTLRVSTELNASDDKQNAAFPNRYGIGADYKLNEQTQLFTQLDLARSIGLSSNTALVGMRVKPWTGAELAVKMGDSTSNDAQRIYSDLGLTQRWQLDEHWQTDVAVQRVHVFKPSNLSTGTGLVPSTFTGSSSAVSVGLAYVEKMWSANARAEARYGSDSNINILFGTQRTLHEGMTVASSLSYRHADSGLTSNQNIQARVSLAQRPINSQWSWLNRFDYIDDSLITTGLNNHTRKWLNSTHINWAPSLRTQWSFQYAGKYVSDTIDGAAYRSYTDLIALEVRHDLLSSLAAWDIGAHAARLHSYGSRTSNLSAGVSLGYKLFANTWIAAGYNFLGFRDQDFIGANYRGKGSYVTLRVKVDQDTLGLNPPKTELGNK